LCKFFNYDKENKLIETRNDRGYSQECVATFLGIDVSSYSRKENGKIKISYKEWLKLSEILEIPMEEIYEYDENITVIFRDNSSGVGNVAGNNVINYSIPQSLLESQNKYIEKLEEENRNLMKSVY
jgi:Predicted transcriptional regulators